MLLPMTVTEVEKLGWDHLDVILVTGDCYIDSPHIGVAIIGKWLVKAGFKVGIIAQPDVNSPDDITRLGAPRLFWGVTGGSVDSMVANYTATKRRRKTDDYTPGTVNDKRPDRAAMVYTNLIRRNFKPSPPIVLGGLEASLRRIAHYDFWTDSVRRSILFDAKADYLLYGMAESSVVELAVCLREALPIDDIRGLCRISKWPPNDYLKLPSYEESAADKSVFTEMFHTFYSQLDPVTAKGMVQQHGDRWLVHNPPSPSLSVSQMDSIYDMDFEREPHPAYRNQGDVIAMNTLRFSVPTHRGCYGECNFCGIAVHQGRTVQWRSEKSILAEVESITRRREFNGYLSLGGNPTGNMYGFECARKHTLGACSDKRCLFPTVCEDLKVNHARQTGLLQKIRNVRGIKKVFVTSGIRFDLVLADKQWGEEYLRDLVQHSISGQMKLAPEHTDPKVLKLMGKPDSTALIEFAKRFNEMVREGGTKQFLTYYLIAAHPGCGEREMHNLRQFVTDELHISPEQVQIYTPLPSTWSAVMYYTEADPFTGRKLFVEKIPEKKNYQKRILTGD